MDWYEIERVLLVSNLHEDWGLRRDLWDGVCTFSIVYLSVCLFVYGCMGVWVYGCMGVWVCECISVRVYGCVGVWVYGCMGV